MRANERDTAIIEKVLDYCTQISDTHEKFNDSYDQFSSDFIYRNAICLCLLKLGVGSLTQIYPRVKSIL